MDRQAKLGPSETVATDHCMNGTVFEVFLLQEAGSWPFLVGGLAR